MNCPNCGWDDDYFTLINNLKRKFEKETGFEPNMLIVDTDIYYDMENSQSIIDRLVYIKDTVSTTLAGKILGLTIVKTKSIKGIRVAYSK